MPECKKLNPGGATLTCPSASTATVGPLSKIALNLQPIDPESQIRPNLSRSMEFVYGVGANGLTSFEKALHGKTVGDSIIFPVPPMQLSLLCEHLARPLIEAVGQQPPFEIRITVANVQQATNRELVRAMAQMGSCGCDCGCGCG
jgi:hypothetical protein